MRRRIAPRWHIASASGKWDGTNASTMTSQSRMAVCSGGGRGRGRRNQGGWPCVIFIKTIAVDKLRYSPAN
jgi:hypothetical protein